MYGEWKFRFLALAVRSSSRCSCGTPQPKLRRAVPALSKTISLPDFVKGERSECHLPLTTRTEKHAYQG